MHFSALLPGKKKKQQPKTHNIINQLKQVSLHQQQGQGTPSMQSLARYNTKGFFFCVCVWEGGSTETKGFKCKLYDDSTILKYYHACEGLLKIR